MGLAELLLLVVLIIVVIGAVPRWPYSQGWGWGPSGILSFVLLLILIALLFRVVL